MPFLGLITCSALVGDLQIPEGQAPALRTNAAISFGKFRLGRLLWAFVPVDFSFGLLWGNLKEGKDRLNALHPGLIVPDGKDRLGQFARILFYRQFAGSLHNSAGLVSSAWIFFKLALLTKALGLLGWFGRRCIGCFFLFSPFKFFWRKNHPSDKLNWKIFFQCLFSNGMTFQHCRCAAEVKQSNF